MNPILTYLAYIAINISALATILLVLYLMNAGTFLMSAVVPMFQEVSTKDSKTIVFSWRKALTALVGLNFIVTNQAYVWFEKREMAASAVTITMVVFGFYFTKEVWNRLNIGKSEDKANGQA